MAYREQELPPEADRSILLVGLNGVVVGLDRETGTKRWENQLPGGGTGTVFIAQRYGLLIVSASRERVYRLDYRTGKTVWTKNTSSAGRATIVVESDLIVVAKGGYVDAFDHDGAALWRQPLRGKGLGRVALGFPGNLAQADDYAGQ